MAPCTSPQDLVRASCGLTTIGDRNRSYGGGVPMTEAARLTIWYAMSVLEAVVYSSMTRGAACQRWMRSAKQERPTEGGDW